MSEYTKSEILLNDLNAIETQVSILVSNCSDITSRKSDLEKQLESAQIDISELTQRVVALESELSEVKNEKDNNTLFNSLSSEERANLKSRLQNLLTRIDYHISS
ncbi:MAG: hypothetical protein IIB07_02700 [Bacteroidetes bacterium]|nr:hypothetical protein [Bacteroidota bacterium]MCH8170028.1 hypothetical protein [Bacteroidota bacterium]MCH8941402.1 hypothetical protein [Bacteroidota bacterium]